MTARTWADLLQKPVFDVNDKTLFQPVLCDRCLKELPTKKVRTGHDGDDKEFLCADCRLHFGLYSR